MDILNESVNFLTLLKIGVSTTTQQLWNWLQQGFDPRLRQKMSLTRSRQPRSRLLKFLSQRLKFFPFNRFLRNGGWALAVVGLMTWKSWNGALLISTAAGIGVMLLAYPLQQWNWQRSWSSLDRLLYRTPRPFIIAVASGGGATLLSYVTISLWVHLENPWLAGCLIAQMLGTVVVTGLLLGQRFDQKTAQTQTHVNQMLADLSQENPVQRLIAVRKLTQFLTSSEGQGIRSNSQSQKFLSLHPTSVQSMGMTPSQLAECFSLMLNQETEPTIRTALFEGLQVLEKEGL